MRPIEESDAKDLRFLFVLSLTGSLICWLVLMLADNPNILAIPGAMLLGSKAISLWFDYKSAKAGATNQFRRERAFGQCVFACVTGVALFLYCLFTEPGWSIILLPLASGVLVRFHWNVYKRESMPEGAGIFKARTN